MNWSLISSGVSGILGLGGLGLGLLSLPGFDFLGFYIVKHPGRTVWIKASQKSLIKFRRNMKSVFNSNKQEKTDLLINGAKILLTGKSLHSNTGETLKTKIFPLSKSYSLKNDEPSSNEIILLPFPIGEIL